MYVRISHIVRWMVQYICKYNVYTYVYVLVGNIYALYISQAKGFASVLQTQTLHSQTQIKIGKAYYKHCTYTCSMKYICMYIDSGSIRTALNTQLDTLMSIMQ